MANANTVRPNKMFTGVSEKTGALRSGFDADQADGGSPLSSLSTVKQATSCPPYSFSCGCSWVQGPKRRRQRALKAQPGGGLSGLGSSPVSLMRSRLSSGLSRGVADSSAWVYG